MSQQGSYELSAATIVQTSHNLQYNSPQLVVRAWWNSVEVCIPDSMTSALCGLCEDYTKDESVDITLADGEYPPGSANADRWAAFDLQKAR